LQKNRHFYVPRPSFFVCPGDAPVAITQNVAWMKRQFSTSQTPCSMYPSIFNSFPVRPIALFEPQMQKNRRFHVHFCFPWRRPCDYHAICCTVRKTIQCLPNPSQHVAYLSIFNCFRVIRCVSPKIAIFTTFFVSPGDAHGAITLNVVWMEREFDAYKLSRWMCSSNYKRLRFSDRARYWSKIVIFSYPLH